ncbi:FAD-binding oxidoreductase [Ruegeria sp.]|uniref:FAD-binding oxidoreductase n=1 Tax=Ruegeria sp. TaxID=1879320 RepID=UPI003C7CC509
MNAHTAPDRAEALKAALEDLSARFPDNLTIGRGIRDEHSHGDSWHDPARPDAVFFADSTEQVSEVLKTCHRFGVPVIPFGAGSCIEAQVQAHQGGIALDTTRMNTILAVRAEDMDCTVQCGVTRQQLNEDLRATGLFFPVDLGAHATLGGMAATRASGTTTVKYGSMKDLVLSLTVVLPNGDVIRTGQRARKSSAGYDLTRLMIGSEGTLGVITELTLRLFGQPETAQAAMCSFDTIDAATQTVVEALQMGLGLNRIELADTLQMQAINAYSNSDWPEKPTLFLDLTGFEPAVEHDLALLEELAQGNGAVRFDKAQNTDAYNAIWRIRHSALYASRGLRPGAKGISTDVCVPISRLPECISEISKVVEAQNITAPLVGHVGDGNFHLVLLFDPEDPDEFARAKLVNETLVGMAIEMEGTCTGEHGVGLGKKAYLEAEHGPALNLMKTIKRAIDPKNIMNPGKIFDL